MAGIYIHIPFCSQACHYCDFHFSTNLTNKSTLVQSICKEVQLAKDYLKEQQIETIYFGGGTPSLLTEHELCSIFEAIYKNFSVAAFPEITLEANPDDLSEKNLTMFLRNNINRLSIGIQSLDDHFLKFMNRSHSAQHALESIRHAKAAGVDNISIDVIYGIPGQDQIDWLNNLEDILKLDVQHISSYCLTVEPKTVFGKWQQKGKLKVAEDEFSALQYELLQEYLTKGGFESYEISNAAKPGYISKHNSNYWKGIPYLGLGPSAHSFNGQSRRFNIPNNNTYIRNIEKDLIPFESETLSLQDKANEYLLTSIRTMWGCNLETWEHLAQQDLQPLKEVLSTMVQEKLITCEGNIAKLTLKGRLLADIITSELFI